MDPIDIKEMLHHHHLWLKGMPAGRPADFAGQDLVGADLAGADLRRANLHGANLRNAKLFGANLAGADFRGATWMDGRTCAAASLAGECR